MMDTILNLGLNDRSVAGLAESTANERFAYDSYRRFIQMFGDVVSQIEKYKFEAILDAVKDKRVLNWIPNCPPQTSWRWWKGTRNCTGRKCRRSSRRTRRTSSLRPLKRCLIHGTTPGKNLQELKRYTPSSRNGG